jgi:predicted aspartyl protease
MHVRPAKTLEIGGTIEGADLAGWFRSWQSGENLRYDESVGGRRESFVRISDRQYIVNQSGNVREVRGLLLRRQRTGEFVDEEGFVSKPQYDHLLGKQHLVDGRDAYAIGISPPDGQPETLFFDAKTFMIDRISYDDDDGTSTQDYYDYRVFGGALVAQREVDSNGDHGYDVTHEINKVVVDRGIDASVFSVPPNNVVQTDKPVTVPLQERQNHYYVGVKIHGHSYTFLVDTGAQGVVLDKRVANQLQLHPEGRLEVAGAQRTGGLGLAALDQIEIGGAALPVRMVTVLDLRGATGAFDADGVLGYPFFASAEVTIDAAANTMTFAKPGTLHPRGGEIPIDVDRELIEVQGRVNETDGRFVVDTGNSTELLLFSPFLDGHPGLIPPGNRQFASNYGVGGSARALYAIVDELDMGPYRFFNRNANLMLTRQGAFADRFDAGNIGMGVLRNLVVTFDVANAAMYADRSSAFDDGRYRVRTESNNIPW